MKLTDFNSFKAYMAAKKQAEQAQLDRLRAQIIEDLKSIYPTVMSKCDWSIEGGVLYVENSTFALWKDHFRNKYVITLKGELIWEEQVLKIIEENYK